MTTPADASRVTISDDQNLSADTVAAMHKDMANAIRALAMDAVEAAKSGHPGLPMGLADVATVLFTRFAKIDPKAPLWPDRDRVILSAGHGSMLLYASLYLLGFEDITLEDIKKFRQLDSRAAGHPEHEQIRGVETTTGPLGQGLANGVGMAIAERIMAAQFGGDVVDHTTYVLASDGDLMEGISQEAIALAGHLKLTKLIVLFDDNGISIDGPLSLADSVDQVKRFEAAGWLAERIDGHDPDAIAAAIARAQNADRPVLIACKTKIGFGAPTKEGKASSHGAPLGAEEIKGAREALGWSHAPFVIPEDILSAWRQAGARNETVRTDWEGRLAALDAETRAEFERRLTGDLPSDVPARFAAIKQSFATDKPSMATRKASGETLSRLMDVLPDLVGGSADLTGSNNTRTKDMDAITAADFSGRFIHYGIREHAMAAAMNGMALHGGVIPFSGTFLVFSDYCRPSLRMAALMGQRVIHVMTHDSIGVGEDGPTHQPVEHLASLRAIPNLAVFRPADATETAECWQAAIGRADGPSVLALTRQDLPALRESYEDENLSAKGAYELLPAKAGPAQVTLMASGSEVSLAAEARERLESEGIGTRVVSMPCWELFETQETAYKDAVLGSGTVRIAIEAALSFGWERYIGPDGVFIGMAGFGRSAPYRDLYEHFGITPAAIVKAAKNRLADRTAGASRPAPRSR